jgi:carbamoylphosphate synthase small subunit
MPKRTDIKKIMLIGTGPMVTNIDDMTVERIRHKTEPVFSIQYHPRRPAPGLMSRTVYSLALEI